MTRVILLILLLVGLPSGKGAAQLGAGSDMRRDQDTLEYYELKKRAAEWKPPSEQEALLEKPAPKEPAEREAPERKIWIEEIRTSESEILTPSEIDGLTSPYEGREVSISELFRLIDEFNERYARKKVYVARAVLPPQKVEDGVITIRLIEAHLGDLVLDGNDHTRDGFIKRRLSIEEGELIRLDELERDLVRFNQLYGVRLRTVLEPGEEFGTTDFGVKVEEPGNYKASLFTDNAGRETVGEYRGGINLGIASVFGIRDRLDIGATYSGSSWTAWGSYGVPVHRSGTLVEASAYFGNIKVISGALEALGVGGDSNDVGARVRQPLKLGASYEWFADLQYHYKHSTTTFQGVELFETNAHTVDLVTDLRAADERGYWLTAHRGTIGFVQTGPERDYFVYRGSLTRMQVLSELFSATFRLNGQLTNTNELPSFEQFQVGGIASVRGYSEGLLAGDTGYFLSAELGCRLPPGRLGWFGEGMKGFVFVDNGGAFPFKRRDSSFRTEDILTSVGFGIDFFFTKYLTGRVNVGFPIAYDGIVPQDTVRVNYFIMSQVW